MKYLLFPLIISTFFFSACSSVPRFTSVNNAVESKPSDKVDNGNSTVSETYSLYSDNKPLESVEGIASYYSHEYDGKVTANGEIFDMNKMTAADHKFPFNTIVRVINLNNNKSVILRINDRLPDYNGRIIDVTHEAAKKLGMLISGIAKVKLEVLKWGAN